MFNFDLPPPPADLSRIWEYARLSFSRIRDAYDSVDKDWKIPTPVSPWSVASPLGYRKLSNNLVILRGAVVRSGAWPETQHLFTLPEGYRGASTFVKWVARFDGDGTSWNQPIDISSLDGRVRARFSSNVSTDTTRTIWLDGTMFYQET